MIPLYKVPRNSKIDVSHLDLYTDEGEKVNTLDFKSIDGMYSLCYYKEYTVHLSCNAEVNII